MTTFDKHKDNDQEETLQPRSEFASNYVREVTARYIGPRRKGFTISSPADVASFMRQLLRDETREHFLALYLNGAHHVLSFSLVSLGCATSAPVSPVIVFQNALLVGASAFVVGHNHISGNLEPSPEDIGVTKRLKEAGCLLTIPLLDHVLFSATDYVSFHDRGILA